MILIVTEALDLHANHVVQRLRQRGATVARFDPADVPVHAEVSASFSGAGQTRRVLRTGQEEIDLERVQAVWYRRPRRPIPHPEVHTEPDRQYVAGECHTFIQDLWQSLGCRWIPGPPEVLYQAQLKGAQLKAAADLGFELPPTLITNSPSDFLEFYRAHKGQVVSKLAGFSFFTTGDVPYGRYTEVVRPSDVGYAQAVRYCPMIFQAHVPKRVELRITVVGRQPFAAEIHSQQSNHTRTDWRRYDFYATPYRAHRLPEDVARRCTELLERFGLRFGAIDMIVTPEGRYVFLEINPNGQYLWVEDYTGLPITDALCELLLSGGHP